MSLRVKKSVKIAPGMRINFSNSGVSASNKILPGVYSSTKIVDYKNKTAEQNKRPLAIRWWYIAFALAFFPVGISLIAAGGTGAGVTSIVLGLVMLLFTVRQFSARRKEKKQGK